MPPAPPAPSMPDSLPGSDGTWWAILEIAPYAYIKEGKVHVIEFTMTVPEKGRRLALAALESVWTFGIPEAAWPVNKKRDFGRRVLPTAGQRECPSDADIEPIFRAAEREDDPYMKSLVFVALSAGLRPGNQLAQLQWADLMKWDSGLAIVAKSKAGRRFKTDSPVIARLPPLESEALKEWRARTPNSAPEDYIWPRRPHGRPTKAKASDNSVNREFRAFLRRHQISTWVRLAHFRHWVEYRGEKDGIPAVLLAFMRGHAVKSATEGRLGYSGNRRDEAVLTDQEARWPEGPCGVFLAGKVHVVDELDPYKAVMAEYAMGNMTTDEMARRVESIRLGLIRRSVNPTQ